MIIFLAGVNCVGKTTLGPLIAQDLDYTFYDLDREMEKFYGVNLAFLGKTIFPEPHEFRGAMKEVLEDILKRPNYKVIALNPPGLMNPVYDTICKIDPRDRIIVLLVDAPESIVERVIYYDDDNKLIVIKPSVYMREVLTAQIRKALNFLKSSFKRADIVVDISGCNIEQAWKKVLNETYILRSKQRRVVPGKTG